MHPPHDSRRTHRHFRPTPNAPDFSRQGMKFWESVHYFEHGWQTVTAAHWQKYPNPQNPAVTSVDYLDRQLTPDGKLVTQRMLRTQFALPTWCEKMIGTSSVDVCEESIVDPQAQTLTMRTQNAKYGSVFVLEETITYQADPDQPHRTRMTQEANVSVNLYPSGFLEEQILNTFSKQAPKGREALEFVIQRIEQELHDLGQGICQTTQELFQSSMVLCEGGPAEPLTTTAPAVLASLNRVKQPARLPPVSSFQQVSWASLSSRLTSVFRRLS
eukprot:m.85134 g.85134  ORF g.85134 m.85134 type:complete len:272 (+) comp50858_c0_seq1:2-817(+)